MNATYPFGEITAYAARDGQRLVVRAFPHAAPAAHVVLLHGIVSHSGWYLQCASSLVEQGFAVHVLDRRGSGLNHEQAGDVERYQTWIDDIIAFLDQLPKDKPIILLGISWGGKIAPVIARRRPDLLRGIGLICPGIYAKQQPGWFKRMVMQLANWFGLGGRKVWIPLRDPALFTDGIPWREYIRQDPCPYVELLSDLHVKIDVSLCSHDKVQLTSIPRVCLCSRGAIGWFITRKLDVILKKYQRCIKRFSSIRTPRTRWNSNLILRNSSRIYPCGFIARRRGANALRMAARFVSL